MPKIHRLTIKDYQYNNLCDTYGCNNRAKHSLGREGYPKRAAHNVCDACLKDIAMQVPIEMILEREDLQDYINKPAKPEDASGAEHIPTADSVPFDGDEAPSPDDIPFSEDFEAEIIDSYSYKELQDIAKDLSLPYVGIKTQDLKDSILIALKEDR